MAHVLVVDDEQSIRSSLGAILRREGHTVHEAADGSAAEGLLQRDSFDVVISDIILPHRSGVDLLGEIRELQPDAQVILITGEPDAATAAEAVRKGAFDYLSKPVLKADIVQCVSAAAEKKRRIDNSRARELETRKYQAELERTVSQRTEEVAASEARFRLLADNAVDAVWQMDLRLRFTYISPSIRELTGHEPEEWIGTRLRDHATKREYRKMARQAISAARNYRRFQRTRFDAMMLRKDGSEVPVEIVGKLLFGSNGLPCGFQGSTRDISDRRAAEERTERLYQNQVKINNLALALGATTGLSDVYSAVYDHVSVLMSAQSVIISFYDEQEQVLRAAFVMLDGKRFDEAKLPALPLAEPGGGTQSQVIHTGESLYVPDYRAARRKGKKEYTVDGEGQVKEGPPPDDAEDITRSAILVPLRANNRLLGVMQVHSCDQDAYTEDDIQLLEGLANVTAVAIANANLLQEVNDALHNTVTVIGKAIEIRDPYTAGHEQRVTALACAIGEGMGLAAERIEGLRMAGLLHDIGKISIPAEILSKPAALSAVERDLIRQHPRVAFELLQDVRFPWPVGEIILQHHERLDGSGYPRGLTAAETVVEARILAVADVVEAMSSHRPYRAALGIEAALKEIEAGKSERYDADVVEACVKLFRESGFEFAEPYKES